MRYGEKTWKGDMGMTGKEAPNKRNVQKFVRYSEGAKMYGMGLTKFQELAKDAKACYNGRRQDSTLRVPQTGEISETQTTGAVCCLWVRIKFGENKNSVL